jgi:hypothetical protein
MKNYDNLYFKLKKSTELLETSFNMKQRADDSEDEFRKYFNETRKGYRRYDEILRI